jgi:hypothetical protein
LHLWIPTKIPHAHIKIFFFFLSYKQDSHFSFKYFSQ